MKKNVILVLILAGVFAFSFFAGEIVALGQDAQLELEFVRFYESPYDEPADREFDTAFPRSTTRYVNYFVGAKNLLYNMRDQNPRIAAKYYRPDGSLLCTIERNQFIPKDWENVDMWHGWGWDNPGNWPVGVYRVDLFFGYDKIADGKFYIYEE